MKQPPVFRAFGFPHCKGWWTCLSKRSRRPPATFSMKSSMIHNPPLTSPSFSSSLTISLQALFISVLPCTLLLGLNLSLLTRWGTSGDRNIWGQGSHLGPGNTGCSIASCWAEPTFPPGVHSLLHFLNGLRQPATCGEQQGDGKFCSGVCQDIWGVAHTDPAMNQIFGSNTGLKHLHKFLMLGHFYGAALLPLCTACQEAQSCK